MRSTVSVAQVYDQVLAQCRVLATLAFHGPMSLDELHDFALLSDLDLMDIEVALANLLSAGRISRRVALVRWREGDSYLRRDVPVYSAELKGGGQ